MLEQVIYNSRIHNMIAPLYESRHREIFNQVEQQRIYNMLRYAIGTIKTGTNMPCVLDFGAGTGNLTRHLLNLNVSVVASDVSSACLHELQISCKQSRLLEVSLLNGQDLAQFADESFDMVATYSVLHHVPDYLKVVREFLRVLKPGGVIYIDHEVCPAYWENRLEYTAYCRELEEAATATKDTFLQRASYIFRQNSWWRYLASAVRVRFSPLSDEGDIHVYPDDHIEWQHIREIIGPLCHILLQDDYLVCRETTMPASIWEKWRNRCVDMRLLVAQKR